MAAIQVAADVEVAERAVLLQQQSGDAPAGRRWRLAAGAASLLMATVVVAGICMHPAREQKRARTCEGGSCQAYTSSLDATLIRKGEAPVVDDPPDCPEGYEEVSSNMDGRPRLTEDFDGIDGCAKLCTDQADTSTPCDGFEYAPSTGLCYVYATVELTGTQKQGWITCVGKDTEPSAHGSGGLPAPTATDPTATDHSVKDQANDAIAVAQDAICENCMISCQELACIDAAGNMQNICIEGSCEEGHCQPARCEGGTTR